MKRLIFALVTLFSLCLASVAARADIVTLTLTNPVQDLSPAGGVLQFEATVFAPVTNLDSVYLNGDAYNVADALTLDDTGFFVDFPLALAPGESFTGVLFKLAVPAGMATGIYANTFSILGGGLGAQDTLATVDFTVNVVPEPSTLWLLATGCLAGLVRVRRNRGPQARQVAA
ncbi:PEP-CTERM sorting domain-containing protein [Roseateles sp. DC23W]|uniref:PEP-CTERM sorting domain-containing protein n=1 Tax=Pelomonas dachongensis TaxID=3299029 RepID=A0ABW7EVA5_9BURK